MVAISLCGSLVDFGLGGFVWMYWVSIVVKDVMDDVFFCIVFVFM